MVGKHMDAGILARLEARTRVVKALVRCAFVLFCVSLGFVVVAMAVPQQRLLKKLEAKVVEAKEREKVALADREHRRIELQALREDPALQARSLRWWHSCLARVGGGFMPSHARGH